MEVLDRPVEKLETVKAAPENGEQEAAQAEEQDPV